MTSPDVTTAVERVRADDLKHATEWLEPFIRGRGPDALRRILADHARLSAALGEAREALDPFAQVASDFGGWPDNASVPPDFITIGDLRRARTALQQQEARDGRE